MAKEHGWAIVGEYGLYVGWCRTRLDAISEHIHAYNDELPFRAWGNKLCPKQKAEWERRKRAGDRAVKVTITYPARGAC